MADDQDEWPTLLEMPPDEVERLVALVDGFNLDHIDIEEEEAEIAQREKIRTQRAFKILKSLPRKRYSETEMIQELEKGGAFEGAMEDAQRAAILKVIRIARQRRN
jgi:hypothetical protein